MSESILNENLIATFEQSLRQTRNAQNRLMVRLREVETEGDRLRQEIEALDNSAEKTEAAIYSILATMGSSKNKNRGESRNDLNNNQRNNEQQNDSRDDLRFEDFTPSAFSPEARYDMQMEAEKPYAPQNNQNYSPNNNYDNESVTYINNDRNQRYNNNQNNNNNNSNSNSNSNNSNNNNYNNYPNENRQVPSVRENIEPINQRFSDRTITQACTLLLGESGSPLHVNDLYNHLVAGGFTFKGNNPTISIAVSLNRNRRFRKVAPGTFDLVMRDASQAAS